MFVRPYDFIVGVFNGDVGFFGILGFAVWAFIAGAICYTLAKRAGFSRLWRNITTIVGALSGGLYGLLVFFLIWLYHKIFL